MVATECGGLMVPVVAFGGVAADCCLVAGGELGGSGG